jgi:broad specificity polyphosphatase/5'/3'-nucleotidase SurE
MKVLLVNDDVSSSPLSLIPGATRSVRDARRLIVARSSPFILPWYNTLKELHPTWDISVVIPDSQKSWISKAFHIAEKITATFFDPKTGATLSTEQSSDNWVLLNGLSRMWTMAKGRYAIDMYEYRFTSCLW